MKAPFPSQKTHNPAIFIVALTLLFCAVGCADAAEESGVLIRGANYGPELWDEASVAVGSRMVVEQHGQCGKPMPPRIKTIKSSDTNVVEVDARKLYARRPGNATIEIHDVNDTLVMLLELRVVNVERIVLRRFYPSRPVGDRLVFDKRMPVRVQPALFAGGKELAIGPLPKARTTASFVTISAVSNMHVIRADAEGEGTITFTADAGAPTKLVQAFHSTKLDDGPSRWQY